MITAHADANVHTHIAYSNMMWHYKPNDFSEIPIALLPLSATHCYADKLTTQGCDKN